MAIKQFQSNPIFFSCVILAVYIKRGAEEDGDEENAINLYCIH